MVHTELASFHRAKPWVVFVSSRFPKGDLKDIVARLCRPPSKAIHSPRHRLSKFHVVNSQCIHDGRVLKHGLNATHCEGACQCTLVRKILHSVEL